MNSKGLIGGIVAGVAVGMAIGLLLAPASGKETRNRKADGSRKLTGGLKSSVKDSIDSLKGQVSKGLDEVARKGKEVYSTAKDGLKV